MVKWIITKYQHAWVGNQLAILVWTDEPIHASLHYSLSPETYSYITSIRRGIRRLIKPLWELPNQVILGQTQKGDTWRHAFLIPGIPDQANLTFFITGTNKGSEAKSVSVPIKVQHPIQGGADPIDNPGITDNFKYVPWEQNSKCAVGIHDDCWDLSGMTGTATIVNRYYGLILNIEGTPGSIAQAYTDGTFALNLDPALQSQLRIIVNVPHICYNLHAYIVHGSIDSGSGYGFEFVVGAATYWCRNSDGITHYPWYEVFPGNRWDLLEAKLIPGVEVQFFTNGTYYDHITTNVPDTPDLGFHARITDPDHAYAQIQLRRFMLWQESIWTGAYHGI